MGAKLSICTVKGFRLFRWVGVLHVKFVTKIRISKYRYKVKLRLKIFFVKDWDSNAKY